MAKYILHGGFERRENELNNSFYRELVKDLSEGDKVLLVYFASEHDDIEEEYQKQSNRIKEVSNKELNFMLATEADFINQLREASAVHFRGGDTDKLLNKLRIYHELLPLLKEKQIVSGSSAGAYALAKYGTAHDEEHARPGLGVLPLRIVCHYESLELPPSESSYAELIEMTPEFELVKLRDCEWRLFK